jgi:urea transporter
MGSAWTCIPDGRAYTLATSVLAIAIALTHHDAIAFLTYALLSLVLVVVVQMLRDRRQAA